MEVQRRFLGWCEEHGPASVAARALLHDAPRGVDGGCDLSRTIVVTATGRSLRLLNHGLAEAAHELGKPLIPPARCTVASLAARALAVKHASRPIGGIEWMLLMHEALRRLPNDAAALLMPQVMRGRTAENPVALSRIASALDQVTQQLVQSGRSAAEVAQLPCVSPLLADRWNALHAFHCQCDVVARELSQAHGVIQGVMPLTPWQWNDRLMRSEGEGTSAFERVVLLGVLDLTPMNRRVVVRLVQGGCAVEAWIIAPDSQPWNEGAFDALGCVASDADGLAPDISDEALEPAEDALDQCEAALARFSVMCAESVGATGRKDAPTDAAAQPVVVSCDPDLTPLLQAVALRHGRSVHAGSGAPYALTLSGSLLRATAQLHAQCTPATLAQFLSQPAVLRALRGEGLEDPRKILDRLRAEHLLHSVSDLGQVLDKQAPIGAKLVAALNAIGGGVLPKEVATAPPASRSVVGSVSVLMAWMTRLLRGSLGDPAQLEAHRELQSAAESLAGSAFKDSVLPMGTIVAVLQQHMESQEIPVPPEGTEIEAIGWLDALFEPSRRMVLLGLREGTVPSQPQPDGWLTDPIRLAIGLPGRTARLHRDAALLAAVSARASSLSVIGGMVDSRGEPVRPSRLIFPRRAEAQARRILRLYGEVEEDSVRMQGSDGDSAAFHAVPNVTDFGECEVPTAVSVTSCASYLAGAYDFWLTNVLDLNEPIVFSDVMQPRHFGVLLHQVVRRLAGPTPRDGSEAAWMEVLEHELDIALREQFGNSPAPALVVQRTAAVARVRSALRWHLEQAAEGWEIRAAEWPFPEDEQLLVDGDPIRVRGRIDRIDVNARAGRWRVIDYKFGDSSFTASRMVAKQVWKNPQIPLYVHLVPRSFVDLAPLKLSGHVLIVDAMGGAELVDFVADGSIAREGVAAMKDMIRAVRARKFGVPKDYKPDQVSGWRQRDSFSSLLRRVAGGGGVESADESEGGLDGEAPMDGGAA
ncbi:MAG: PD-(D/E)XK nuclease family protein [Planctomycetota bacterium]